MNYIIALIDLLGVIGFLGATIFSYKNHDRVKDASNLWLYFGTASIMAIIWTVALIFEQFMQLPEIIEPTLFFAVIFLFSLVAMGSLFDFVKLQGKIQ